MSRGSRRSGPPIASLHRAGQVLHELAIKARTNAHEQIATSNDYSGAASAVSAVGEASRRLAADLSTFDSGDLSGTGTTSIHTSAGFHVENGARETGEINGPGSVNPG